MKNLTLINTTWKQRVTPTVTDAERTLLLAPTTSGNREAKRELNESIKTRSLADVSTEEAEQAQAIFDAHKIDGSSLIAADISLPNGIGIINCRVNGKHSQVRF